MSGREEHEKPKRVKQSEANFTLQAARITRNELLHQVIVTLRDLFSGSSPMPLVEIIVNTETSYVSVLGNLSCMGCMYGLQRTVLFRSVFL